jgi:hypothetical protein
MLLSCWLIVAAILGATNSSAGPSVGRLGILADVHGYTTAGRTLVPMRGIAEWLGASVEYHRPRITIALGPTVIGLVIGSEFATVNGNPVQLSAPAKVYGGITCVPLRFVGEALGLKVSYHSQGSLETDNTDGMPVVVLEGHGKTGRVLVHEEPPNVVGKVMADLSNSIQSNRGAPESLSVYRLGAFARDWILRVTKIHDGYFFSTHVASWNDDADIGVTGFWSDAAAVYGIRGGSRGTEGKWVQMMAFQDCPSYKAWANAGIPVSVARELGVCLENY